MVELKVVYEVYPDGRLTKAICSGETEKDAFLDVLDTVGLYTIPEDAEDWTVEEIINDIESQNGDGCDFIYSIKNINTGKIYFEYED